MRVNYFTKIKFKPFRIFLFSTKQFSNNQDYFDALKKIYDDQKLGDLSILVRRNLSEELDTFFNIPDLATCENSIAISGLSFQDSKIVIYSKF